MAAVAHRRPRRQDGFRGRAPRMTTTGSQQIPFWSWKSHSGHEESPMNERAPNGSGAKKIVPFAPAKDATAESETVDRSGEAIVTLVQQAASAAKDNCDRAMDVAHKLSLQLRAPEDRIKEPEGEIRHYH